MSKFTLGMLVERCHDVKSDTPRFGIVTCAPSDGNKTTVEVNGYLHWSQDSWIPVCTQDELALFTDGLWEAKCSQPKEASLSGKNSANVRQIGSARRRARLSQNAQLLSSEKKRETPKPTASEIYAMPLASQSEEEAQVVLISLEKAKSMVEHRSYYLNGLASFVSIIPSHKNKVIVVHQNWCSDRFLNGVNVSED